MIVGKCSWPESEEFCLGSSISTVALTETEKKGGSNLGSLYFWGKEQIWRVVIQYWIEEYERAEGWT